MRHLHIHSTQQNGMQLHLCKTSQFKTTHIVLTLKANLQEDTITARALIPYILLRGSTHYPTHRQIQQKLDALYGTALAISIQKKGDYHYIILNMECPNDAFIGDEHSLLQQALLLLHEIIYHPLLEKGVFVTATVEQEKLVWQKRFDSLYHNKMQYAGIRLIEEMYKGEVYRLSAFGQQEDLHHLDAASIYNVYQELLHNDQFDLFIVGEFQEKEVQDMVQHIFVEPHRQISTESILTHTHQQTLNIVQEEADVTQSNLLLGYRTFVTVRNQNYEALKVANAMWGRFPSSKLFIRLREQANIAYFTLSHLESNKGMLIVTTGIDSVQYDYAIQLIREQETALKEGDFTDFDVEQAQMMLINLFLEAQDTPLGVIDLCIQFIESGSKGAIDDQIDKIKAVSKKDIIEVVNQWRLDTIYFLKGKG